MSDDESTFCLAFRHGEDESALGLGFFATKEHAARLFAQSPDEAAEEEIQPEKPESEKLSDIANEFFEQFIAMLDLLPMGAGSTMFIRQIMLQDFVANHIEPRATEVEKNGGKEVYTLPKALFSEANRRLKRATRLASSVSILPSLALLGLVGQFDGYMGRILRRVYEVEPRITFDKDKSVLVKDVLSASSLEEFQSELLDREVDKVLRGSHAELIKHFETILKTQIKDHISDWDAFVEVFERRNLFSHTGGRVSKSYLDRTNSGTSYSLGQQLYVSPQYLHDAASLLLEVGIKIIHIVGRAKAIQKAGEFPNIDDSFIDHSYELLVHGHHKAAKSVLDFSLEPGMKISDPKTEIVLSVNRAICHREAGDFEEAKKILSRYIDMPLEPRFRIPILAILGEVDALCLALKGASPEDIRPEELFGWPAFKWVNSDESFKAVVSEKHPDEYATLEFLLFDAQSTNDTDDDLERGGGAT